MSSFCSAKATHIFSAKNIRILYVESAKTVNEMTLNELVKLTTLWTTGPRSLNNILPLCLRGSGSVLFSRPSTGYIFVSASVLAKYFIRRQSLPYRGIVYWHFLLQKNLIMFKVFCLFPGELWIVDQWKFKEKMAERQIFHLRRIGPSATKPGVADIME